MTRTVEKKIPSGPCAHPDCRRVVDEGCYCYGCRRFICEKHCTNLLVTGHGHPVALHWSIDES